jgi:maleate isomerase
MFTGGTLADDVALAEAMSVAAGGIPCSTTTLATVAALEYLKIRDVSIAVPYTPALTAKVGEFFSKEGYVVHDAKCMETTPESNIAIAKCSDHEIKEVIRRSVVREGTRAVLVTCTNWPATALAGDLEAEGTPIIIDSIAATLWHGLRLASVQLGNDADMQQWGKLLSSM